MSLAAKHREATAYAPASVGNVAAGFDLLGHALVGAGDRVTARAIDEPVVRVASITGCITSLPREAERNTAGRAVAAWRESRRVAFGVELAIEKGIALGSGMGGSAASAVAAVVAAQALLGDVDLESLYPFALAGEAVASGSAHGDNVGPQLLGGLVFATHDRLVRIPVPEALTCVVVHPDQVLETRVARAALAAPYAIGEFVAQSAHLGLLLAGCFRGDLEMIGAGLRDVLVEPRRAPLIQGFAAVKQAALDAGALGASISGAGPSVFAWFASAVNAQAAGAMMRAAFADAGVRSDAYVSPVAAPGARIERCVS